MGPGATSTGWPTTYETLEPFYSHAETLYPVRVDLADGPTEPPHSVPYPFPPVPDETDFVTLRQASQTQALPFSARPRGIDICAPVASSAAVKLT